MENQRLQNVKLNNHWNEFIDEKIKEGKYSSVDEVITDSLKALETKEENQKKLVALRKAVEDGENSGEYTLLNMEEIRINAMKKEGLISE